MDSDHPAVADRAANIYGELVVIYQPRHTFRKASLAEFPKLSKAFYEDTLRFLKSNGFKHLADMEDTTVSTVYPHNETIIRVLCSEDGTSIGACYQVRVTGLMGIIAFFLRMPRNIKTVEFESEFDNGMFIVTTNAEKDQMDAEPGIVRTVLPEKSAPKAILDAHDAALAEFRALYPDASPVRCTSYNDLLSMQVRLQELKSAYRQEIGYVTEQELVRIAGRGKEDLGRAYYAAITKIHNGRR
jgi:hypothetical protein